MIIEKNNMAKNFIIITMCIPILAILFFSIFLLLPTLHFSSPRIQFKFSTENNMFQEFSIIFLSIILEAFPFIMVGTILSSIIQIFVTEEALSKIIPRNRFLGLLCASLIGFIVPICDCGIVPVVRRLLKKGMPLYIGITFMLSVPIINPVVLVSTYYAFSNNINVVILRGGLGIAAAMIIGSIIGIIEDRKSIIKTEKKLNLNFHNHKHIEEHDHDCHCCCGHVHNNSNKKHNIKSTIVDIIDHTNMELHNVGRYLIIGSFLSAIMQTSIPRRYILAVGNHRTYSILAMISLAFLLSVCSETDAFIARTFVGQFTTGSIIAFLIFGPMIDIKNTLMLSGTFKTKFMIKLIFIIFIICFTIGELINYVPIKGGLLF